MPGGQVTCVACGAALWVADLDALGELECCECGETLADDSSEPDFPEE